MVVSTSPRIDYTEDRLDNGLRVILAPDPIAPVVAVDLWYDVGSKHERPGRTGFAHLFEHMMFQGSANVPKGDHFRLVQEAGGTLNASTWFQRTNYFESGPSNQLELYLWLEADRMATLAEALTQETLDNQRDVVKNERRQRYEDAPYGTWWLRIVDLLFPEGHPYHHSTIGSMEDLEAATVEDCRDFFRAYYAPNNCALSIVGDFEPDAARAMVELHLGGTARTEVPAAPDAALQPGLGGERREVVPDRVPLPRIFCAFRAPPVGSRAWYALQMGADVLGFHSGGPAKGSRLHRELVREGVAQDVHTWVEGLAGCSVFLGWVTAQPDADLTALEHRFVALIESLAADPPTDEEMERTRALVERAAIETHFVRALMRADYLSENATVHGGSREGQRAPAGVAVGDPGRDRVSGSGRPETGQPPPARLRARVVTVVAERPIPGRPRPFRFPSFSRARLGNGMQVLACDLPGRTLVTARLVLDAGDACDPQGKEGVASLTGHLVWEGSERYDAETFAAEVETIGAAVGSDADETMTAWVRVPAARAERGLELLAEAVRRPVFAEREVNRLHAEAANSIRQQNARPLMRSLRAFAGFALAPGCRLALPTAGTVETVEGLARDDVVAHHRAFFTPAGAALIVAGDLGVLDVAVTAEHMFGDWAAPEPVRDPRPAREAIGRTAVVVVNRPGSVQSNFVFGHLGVGHDVPDHDVIEVVTHELGGSFNSRINRKLREEKGYTYGAGAAFDERRREGLFYVYAPVETSVTADALRDAIAEVRAVHADGITEAELEDARSYLGGVSAIQFETPGGIAGGLGEIVIHGLPDDHFDAHAARLAEVSLDDAARTARERLRPDRMAIAVVGDAEKIGASLEEFGPMTVVEDS